MIRPASLVLALLHAAAAQAADAPVYTKLPDGWEKLSIDDLPANTARAADPKGFLEARGDFDGNGTPDTAAVYLSRGLGKYAVFVVLAPERIAKVTDGQLRQVANYGIKAVKGAKGDNVAYFRFGSPEKNFAWNGAAFAELP